MYMVELRKEPRSPVMTRVEALWEDETQTARVAPAIIEDKSPGGVCIRISSPISVGSKLTIKSRREQFSGTVANSRRDKTEYILGVQRDDAPIPDTK
jgi:hypothetical protein